MFAGQRRHVSKQKKILAKRRIGYSGFGEVLPTGANAPKLEAGKEYTITVEFSGILMPSESKIEEIAKQQVQGADIVSVNRGLFSGRFVITIKPRQILGLNTTINQLIVGFTQAGYESKLVQIESGEESTKAGGVQQVATETGQAIKKGTITVVRGVSEATSEVAGAAVKPLIPWLIAGVIGLVAFTWWKVGGLDAALKPKQPNGVGKRNYESETT